MAAAMLVLCMIRFGVPYSSVVISESVIRSPESTHKIAQMATALHKALEASALHGGSGQGLLEGHGEASSPVRLAKAQHVMFCTPTIPQP